MSRTSSRRWACSKPQFFSSSAKISRRRLVIAGSATSANTSTVTAMNNVGFVLDSLAAGWTLTNGNGVTGIDVDLDHRHVAEVADVWDLNLDSAHDCVLPRFLEDEPTVVFEQVAQLPGEPGGRCAVDRL